MSQSIFTDGWVGALMMVSEEDERASACVFCEIVAGTAEASVVYEDEVTLALANLRQPT